MNQIISSPGTIYSDALRALLHACQDIDNSGIAFIVEGFVGRGVQDYLVAYLQPTIPDANLFSDTVLLLSVLSLYYYYFLFYNSSFSIT